MDETKIEQCAHRIVDRIAAKLTDKVTLTEEEREELRKIVHHELTEGRSAPLPKRSLGGK